MLSSVVREIGSYKRLRALATQGTLDRVHHNLWVLRFTAEGWCRAFTEGFMKAHGTP